MFKGYQVINMPIENSQSALSISDGSGHLIGYTVLVLSQQDALSTVRYPQVILPKIKSSVACGSEITWKLQHVFHSVEIGHASITRTVILASAAFTFWPQ